MLTLPIKKKWFDMILSGEKKEEYREIKPYWTHRFFRLFDEDVELRPKSMHLGKGQVIFKNGYRKDSPKIKCSVELRLGEGEEKWGAEHGEIYFILKILNVEEIC